MTEPQLRLGRIGVVMLGVNELRRSVAFYRDTLGLTCQAQIPGFAFFQLEGGTVLALSEPLAKNSPQIVGATEIVFHVDDVTAAYEALRGRGVEFLHAPRAVAGESWAANFADPDGHRLSLFGPQRKT